MTDPATEGAIGASTDAPNDTEPRRANVIGLGLIGGSIALALRARGWQVCGDDVDAERVHRAIELGAIDGSGVDADADITFVAVPVLSSAEQVERALSSVIDRTSFADLVMRWKENRARKIVNWDI